MDPLSVVREYVQQGKGDEIRTVGDEVDFGGCVGMGLVWGSWLPGSVHSSPTLLDHRQHGLGACRRFRSADQLLVHVP